MGPIIRLLKLAAQAAALTGLLWLPGSVLGTARPAAAQTVSLSVEFRTALEPYGSFRRIARWGDVWVPAHVSREWRPYTVGHWVYSDDHGWYWVFVRPRDFLATSIATVIIEPEPAILHETVVVNETVVIRQHNFAVNPGIEPAFLAAEIGRPIPAFQVQPRILAGTANIQGA